MNMSISKSAGKDLRVVLKQCMAESVARDGLRAANRGSVFWSKADAMQTLALVRANSNRYIKQVSVPVAL